MLSALALVGALAACGGTGKAPEQTSEDVGPTTSTDPPASADSATTTEPQPDGEDASATGAATETTGDPDPREPCDAGEQAEWLDLAGDGSPDAFRIGEGSAAVILLHQNDGRACSWVPFAESLAEEGYAVLVPVMRPGRWPQPVIGLAAEHLHEEGTQHLALVGASMGGTYAIAATPELDPAPDLVVAVSAPDFYQGSSARDAIADLALPTLFVVAEHDRSFVPEAESLAAAAQDPELVILPGVAAHGIRLLDLEPEAATTVLEALREHAPTSR